ncbi:MAG TPA: RNA polymerase sigma factor [Polyangia bacterium]
MARLATDSASDSECLEMVRRGQSAGAEALFARHALVILRFAGRMTGSLAEAEEICQEVFLRLIDRCDQFDGRGNVVSWLLSIAANACRDHLRRGQRRRLVPIAAAAEVAAREPSAFAVMVNRENGHAVAAALTRLSVEQREALVLARYHELPYAEIARTLGISEGAVKTRVFRAMEALKAELATEQPAREQPPTEGAVWTAAKP